MLVQPKKCAILVIVEAGNWAGFLSQENVMETNTNQGSLKLSDTVTVTILKQWHMDYMDSNFAYCGGHNADGSRYTRDQAYDEYVANYDERNGVGFSIRIQVNDEEYEFDLEFAGEGLVDGDDPFCGFVCDSDSKSEFNELLDEMGVDGVYEKLDDFLCEHIDLDIPKFS